MNMIAPTTAAMIDPSSPPTAMPPGRGPTKRQNHAYVLEENIA